MTTPVSHPYTLFATAAINKLANLSSDALKVMLLTSYTVGTTQDTAEFVADVLAAPASELSATGYTAGGMTLTGVTISASSHTVTLTCNNLTWTAISGAPAFALFYDSTPGTSSTNPVIAYWDFGGSLSPAGQNLTLSISTSGLITWTGT